MCDTEKPKSPWPMERGEDAVRKLEYIWKFLQDKRKFHIEERERFLAELQENAIKFLEAVTKPYDGMDHIPVVESEIRKLQEWMQGYIRHRAEAEAIFETRIIYQVKLKQQEEIGNRKNDKQFH